jgi:hypothetical protein
VISNCFEIEASLQNTLQYKRQHPSASFRGPEQQFHIKKKDRIHNRWKDTQGSKSERDPTNLKLDKYQEKVFSWYLSRLWEIGVPLRQKTIATAANKILAAAARLDDTPPPTVEENWATRWLHRHDGFPVQRENQLIIFLIVIDFPVVPLRTCS